MVCSHTAPHVRHCAAKQFPLQSLLSNDCFTISTGPRRPQPYKPKLCSHLCAITGSKSASGPKPDQQHRWDGSIDNKQGRARSALYTNRQVTLHNRRVRSLLTYSWMVLVMLVEVICILCFSRLQPTVITMHTILRVSYWNHLSNVILRFQ